MDEHTYECTWVAIGEHIGMTMDLSRFETLGPFETREDASRYIADHFADSRDRIFHVVPLYDPEKFHQDQAKRA